MVRFAYLFMFLLLMTACQSQSKNQIGDKVVGGPCEGCEAIYEYGNQVLNSIDTLPGFDTTELKLELSGVVYEQDGVTPAKDVIIYIYQTNRKGLYINYSKEKGWAERHGSIRGWVKTDAKGAYRFYTFRPGAYPGGTEPEHIHITVKEPGKTEYYIDVIVFDDDPLLTKKERDNLEGRGGSGLVTPKMSAGLLRIKRDIILGKNIPDY